MKNPWTQKEIDFLVASMKKGASKHDMHQRLPKRSLESIAQRCLRLQWSGEARAPAEDKTPLTPVQLVEERMVEKKRRDAVKEQQSVIDHLTQELKSREDQLLVLQELRKQKPLDPILAPNKKGTSPKQRVGTPVMLCSDWHVEEPVEPAKVAGLNEYNLAIADKCISEMAVAYEWLGRDARYDCRTGIVWLGGDLFSGYIHAELAESNFLSPVQAVKWLQERVERMLRTICKTTDHEKIRVVCNDGNHGRLTQKMRCSTRTANSLEWLLYQTLAARCSDEPRLQFMIAEGEQNYVEVYKQTIAFMHGDSFRYQGGVGGLLIPVRRGLNELRKYRPLDYLVIGHFHQRLDAGDIVVNGSMIGINSYSMNIKASPEPRQQSWFLMDSERGKCISTPIWFNHGAAR